ncbi:M28 family peptidase [bacterium]|nr:M28 family peptidase [bacterium]
MVVDNCRQSRAILLVMLLGLTAVLAFPGLAPAADVNYEATAEAIDQGRITTDIRAFEALGSRVSGYPGNGQAADMILERFKSLGLETMVQEFDLPSPVDGGSTLTIGDRSYDLSALWPNHARTCQVPGQGLRGPVIYVGHGSLADFNGQDTDGAIVLMDFNTQQNWLNAALLNAAAVVFIEPVEMTRPEAEMKFVRAPINVPRFYVRGADASDVLARVAEGRATGTITARQPLRWQSVANRNILGILRGRDPELSKEAIIIESYYDSISMVPRLAPGAENATGIAMMLEMARLLKANRPARSVIFLACSGHFEAMAGAREFEALWGREPRKARNRQDQLKALQKELAELQRSKEALARDLQALDQKRAELSEREKTYFKNVVNVGQLELSPEMAAMRQNRLDRDIARKNNEIAIWQRLDQFDKIQLFVGLDLSTRSAQFGPFQCGWYYNQSHLLRFYSPLGKQLVDYAEAASDALGYQLSSMFVDGINPVKGREWNTFFPGKVAFDHEMIIRGGRPGIVLATVNDGRPLMDTPLDTFQSLDLDNLKKQTRLLGCVLSALVNDETLGTKALKRIQALKKMDDLKDVLGTVLEFRRHDSYVPNTPVPGALVMIQGSYRMMMGVHTEVQAIANETSEFLLRGEPGGGGQLEAYGLDSSTGDITYAPDMGPDGDKKYPRAVSGRSGLKRPVIVFHCTPTDIFDLVDERYFQTLQKVFIYDAKDYSEPISFGYSLSSMGASAAEFPSYTEPCAVIYSLPEVDLQITMGMGLLGVRMILINATNERPTGLGFPAGQTARIAFTPLQVGQDMWRIDEFRMAKLRTRGIRNARLEKLHADALESLKLAQQELQARRYDKCLAAARHSWGYESRAYPDVQKTAIDVVKGVLFYLAILLPFAYFGERLLISSRTIIGMILGTLATFMVVFFMLAMVHPAFTLTANPPIILLAFIIMALAVMVISIVTMKFNEQLKAMKQARGGVHEADVGRLSAAAAAFSLGIANMRRRKLRTGLTATTLILLTFTVLSFTSVREALRTNEILMSQAPAYQGVMLRDRAWLSLEEPTADILTNELAKVGTVATRSWYTSAQVDKELMIDVTNAAESAKKYVVSTILGLSPQEEDVMDVKRFLVAGRWFKPGDKDVALLPTGAAEALGIGPDQLGSAQVQVFGTRFRVIGLVSEDQMRKVRDLDGEPMMPVNYALLRPEVLKELQRQAEQRSQLGTTTAESLLQEYKHFGPEKLIILPYDTTLELGGTLRSLAVRYHDPAQVLPSVRGMMNRFALSLYAGYQKQTYLFSSVGVTSFSGLEQLVIPILIAALIVLNTMLGSVHERVREIGIYSSLGLAPVHVSMLFLAEASVFANLGAILGYLLGQVITKILYATGSMHGIELNYSSMSAVSVTIIVIIVVLLSTLYPSKKAGEIASPGLDRKWSLPEPEGDLMTIVLPFTVTGRDAFGVAAFLKEFFDEYVGYAGGEFLAEDVRLMATDHARGEGITVALRMWLAPYDLGVSQDFRLSCEPTEDGGIYAIVLRLDRLAGDITSWKKTNTLFLAGIRKQFLIWRTVSHSEKTDYADRAEKIMNGEDVDSEAV